MRRGGPRLSADSDEHEGGESAPWRMMQEAAAGRFDSGPAHQRRLLFNKVPAGGQRPEARDGFLILRLVWSINKRTKEQE